MIQELSEEIPMLQSQQSPKLNSNHPSKPKRDLKSKISKQLTYELNNKEIWIWYGIWSIDASSCWWKIAFFCSNRSFCRDIERQTNLIRILVSDWFLLRSTNRKIVQICSEWNWCLDTNRRRRSIALWLQFLSRANLRSFTKQNYRYK